MKGSKISRAASRTTTVMAAQTDRNTTRPRLRGLWMMISVIAPSPASRPWEVPGGGRSFRPAARNVGEKGRQVVESRRQVLRHDAHVGDDRHEVRVAFPARNDVHVEVFADAR